MKFKLTPTRISFLAFSAFGALVAQELMRSDAPAPSATPLGSSKFKRKATIQPLATVPNTAQLLSAPEAMPFQAASTPSALTVKASQKTAAQPKQSKAPQPFDLLMTPPLSAMSESISAPPSPLTAKQPALRVRTFSVDSLPIDAVVNASLASGDKSKPRAAKAKWPPAETADAPPDQAVESKPAAPASASLPTLASSPTVAPPSVQTMSRSMPPTATPQFSSDRSSTAAPLSAADQDYMLGSGDKLRVDIFNVPEYSKEYAVLVNGTINLQRVGSLNVSGMSLKQVQRAIATRYAGVIKNPLVDVSLVSARPLSVAIAGEVGRPGTYPLTLSDGKFPTVTKLLQAAGGMSRSANPREVIVRRPQLNGRNREIRVDLWDLFRNGNLRQDLTLLDGDEVFVPTASSTNLAEASQLAAANFTADASQPINIAVVGEVNRPGPHPLAVKAGLPTVTQAIQTAGGIAQLADIRKVEVRRTTRNGTVQVIPVNLAKLLQEGDLSQDLVLQQNDTISIPTATALSPEEAKQLGAASFSPGTMNINVVGEVERPGSIQLASNSPLNQAILSAGGFNKRAKRRSVELIRLNPNGSVTRREIAVDLARGIDEKGNPILQNGDVIVVERSGLARFSDGASGILEPVGRILPFRFLLGL